MAEGTLINGETWNGDFTLTKQAGTLLTLQTARAYIAKAIELTLNAQTASPSFDGGSLNNKSASATFTNMTTSSTNTSGIAIATTGSAGRSAVLYDGAVNGWVNAADDGTVLAASAAENWSGTTYYATGVTLTAGRAFDITVPNGSGTPITLHFAVDANGNTTVTDNSSGGGE